MCLHCVYTSTELLLYIPTLVYYLGHCTRCRIPSVAEHPGMRHSLLCAGLRLWTLSALCTTLNHVLSSSSLVIGLLTDAHTLFHPTEARVSCSTGVGVVSLGSAWGSGCVCVRWFVAGVP